MVTLQVKLSVDDIIASLSELESFEREKLQNALFELQDDVELQKAIDEGINDIENGNVRPHEVVMKEIKAKYNYKDA
jgi:predicted transcriptional regulator